MQTKIVKIITTAAAAIMLASCSNPLETQLMGSWTLQECEIPKLDSVCAATAAEDVESTNKAIELLHHQLDSTKSADKQKELLEQEKQLKADLDNCTPDKVKEEYQALCKKQINAFNINFNDKKQIQIHVPGVDVQYGTWRVTGDTIITLFDNQPAEIMIVKDITSKNLTLFIPSPGDRLVDLVMKFGKN
ncbi:MAG: hypothetical protein II852_05485 [Bacteroidales bacterium]|jgi:hypothetical protein|nr:hypothetical protein [Bacteroidales bacterium]